MEWYEIVKKPIIKCRLFYFKLNRTFLLYKRMNRKEILNKINQIKETFNYSMNDGFTTIVGNKNISEGCKCCKNGTWLCIIIGTICNLDCAFCKRTESQKNGDFSKGFGVMQGEVTLEKLDFLMQNYNLYKGVSYTGGEPFMYIDRILKFSNYINDKYPDLYQWIYTNGVLTNEENFKILFDSGIKEVRFNLAATNYSNNVLQKIRIARNIFPIITVEIPVLKEQFLKFKSVLIELNDIGIDHINLHNLLAGNEDDIFIVYDMLKEISDGNYNFNAHDCTLLNLENQGLGFQYQENIINGYKGSFTDFKFKKLLFNNILTKRFGD